MLAMGSNTLMPYGHKRAQAAYATQSATLLRSSNHSYNGAFQVSSYFTAREQKEIYVFWILDLNVHYKRIFFYKDNVWGHSSGTLSWPS